MVIPMLKIRRPLGRLIFNMGIAIPGKTVLLIETAPRGGWFMSEIDISMLRQNWTGFVAHVCHKFSSDVQLTLRD